MKVVLDSSVLIAAAISRAGVCADLLEDVLTHHDLVVSDFILDEVARKLREKFGFPASEARRLRRFLAGNAVCVTPEVLPPGACRDATDLPVLGTATAGNAELLVTADKDLLVIGEFRSTRVIRPAAFWASTM